MPSGLHRGVQSTVSSKLAVILIIPGRIMGSRSQQTLERWRMQKEAQIEDMMRLGIPLGTVAAALASPETAERIAVLEAATSGNMSAPNACRNSSSV